MAKVCPKCNADNSDTAKYCEQCSAPISPEADAEVAARNSQSVAPGRNNMMVNWLAIIVILLIIAGAGWLIFANHPVKTDPMQAAAGAPEAGADASNPHAQVPAQGGAMNADIMKQLADGKAALAKDPLDTKALASLYQMYGMIGRQAQMRPYLDKAYEALINKRKELGKDAPQMLAEIVLAAMSGQDTEGATDVLKKYQQLDPTNTSILGMLGDVYFDGNQPDEAIKWYTQYLNIAKPEEAGETYWRVKTDRATMYMNSGKPIDGKDGVQLAVSELEYITQQAPGLWNAWFNLGVAYSTSKQKDKAKAAWEKALTLSNGEADKWRVQSELAKLEGKEPPPPPPNPHGNMGEAPPGTPNPHGGTNPGGAGDAADPHGGMGGGMENPHGGGGSQSGSGA